MNGRVRTALHVGALALWLASSAMPAPAAELELNVEIPTLPVAEYV
jgi:hypothetical protein